MDPLTPPTPVPAPNSQRPPLPAPMNPTSPVPPAPLLSSSPVPTPAPVPVQPAKPIPVPGQSPQPAPAPRQVPFSSPLDEALDDDEGLSPLSVMNKRPAAPAPKPAPVPVVPAPQAPAAPAPVPVSSAAPASSVPTPQPFILPSQTNSPQAPAPVAPAPVPVQPLVLTPAPAPKPAPVPVAPTPAIKPLPTAPVKPSAPISRPVVANKGKLPIGMLAGVGLIIALGLLGAGGYVLALNGSRLPILYKLASGLDASGLAVAGQATSYLASHTSYQESGSSLIVAGAADETASLPDNDAGDVGTGGGVTNVKVAVTSADPLLYDLKSQGLSGRLGLTLDTSSELPVYLNTHPTGLDSQWLFNLPANTVNPLVAVKPDDLRKNLLYPAIQPVALPQILAAVKSEDQYQKVNGQSISHYTYSLDTSRLAANLPVGATPSSASADVYYRWKTAEPVQTSLVVNFNYQSRTYTLTQTFGYGKWDTELASAEADKNLAAVLSSDTASQALQVEAQLFIPQLGTELSSIPNTYETIAIEAIVPTGESVTEAGSVISTVPPLPPTPASEEAIKRDTQRLADLADLQKALQAYKTKIGSYPKVTGLAQTQANADLIKALVPTYLTKMPVDPLKDTYWYEYVSDGSTYTVRSVAEDSSNSQAALGKAFYYFAFTSPTS